MPRCLSLRIVRSCVKAGWQLGYKVVVDDDNILEARSAHVKGMGCSSPNRGHHPNKSPLPSPSPFPPPHSSPSHSPYPITSLLCRNAALHRTAHPVISCITRLYQPCPKSPPVLSMAHTATTRTTLHIAERSHEVTSKNRERKREKERSAKWSQHPARPVSPANRPMPHHTTQLTCTPVVVTHFTNHLWLAALRKVAVKYSAQLLMSDTVLGTVCEVCELVKSPGTLTRSASIH